VAELFCQGNLKSETVHHSRLLGGGGSRPQRTVCTSNHRAARTFQGANNSNEKAALTLPGGASKGGTRRETPHCRI
jgi:hypothetical protein